LEPVSFNVGVETPSGHIAAAAFRMLLGRAPAREQRPSDTAHAGDLGDQAASAAVVIAGGYWLVRG
jgi:hypothetical protein